MSASERGLVVSIFLKAKSVVQAIDRSLKESIRSAPPELRKMARKLFIIIITLVIVISVYKTVSVRMEEKRREEEIAAGPRIPVSKVTKGPGEHTITLVAETRPFESATLYAKVSGYLKRVDVDKGDIVKEGQILAVIESPETDEAFIGAEADARNKKAINTRLQTLLAKGLVSQQEADQAQADNDVAAARLRAQATLKKYETLRAPFDGTITARYADPGALVQNATSSETSALPVVMISQIKKLRVDAFVDQRDAPYVSKNDPVVITMSERPGFKIEGQLARLSGELDPRTKMLLAEIDIENENHSMVAGSFVQVALRVQSPAYLEAPVEAMILKDNKPCLTVVTPENTLAYKMVEIAGNDGKVVQIVSGVSEGDRVALNLGDSLTEGHRLRPVEEPSPAGTKK